ncbi:type II toxin-antitoxin system HicB family antitoxin [Methanospirillum stamsii]|uniref:Type II toxin-antitoxin system HicB family antitoxin n=1 Tax=Methanospirillum stamsii TaxID=1277351 RepID=A0A2V2MTX0_9EURY|nr:type II toxin-antitoxin system HicB family antitoxin [Methanospirillum stamsii]PWR70859.1 type II toxin-antitoxin system HicB family antitoxin [Methanospirillum stamsii]
MQYTIFIMPQEEGGYTVQCLELPGAISQGETVEEALDNIKEAIELLLDVLQDDLRDKLALSTTQVARIEIANVS